MKLHCFQHVLQEGPGTIGEWAKQRGWTLIKTFLSQDPLPKLDDVDWLVVMGGPMSVNDEQALPWLKKEKAFIASAINAGKTVVGVCLGSQLIANALGAKVGKNPYKEIGWFDIEMTPAGLASKAFSRFPKRLKIFQWHGETFDVPRHAVLAATNDICTNQALVYGERVVGLQFHPEVTENDVRAWISHGTEELTNDNYIQTAGEMLAGKDDFKRIRTYTYLLLDNLADFQIGGG